ncbi:MAG TPA: hypothetical protein VG125_07955 [Pirellulales bacterium]|jgi:hypothetical protein|nr:hypothetical protein [Pirellulales bacterium]
MTRLKSAFKWLAMVGGSLLSLALLAFAFLNWRAGACLEQQLQALRKSGRPMSIAELAPSSVEPEQNALTYLRRAAKSAEAIGQELSVWRQKMDTQQACIGFCSLPQEYYDRGRLNDRGVQIVEAALGAFPEATPLIERAADAPDYFPDHDYTLPPERFLETYLERVQQARMFARLLQYRGDLWLARHEHEGVLRNGLTLLRLGRHFQREPMLVAYLFSIAVQSMGVDQVARALADGPVPNQLHDQVGAEISRHLASRAFVAAIESDRAYGIDYFRSIRGVGLPWTFKQDECDYLKRMAEEIEIGATPRYKVETALAQMKAHTQGAGPLTLDMLPALEAAREACLRSRARLQCLSVLNVLTRREEQQDDGTPSIDELNLPDEIKVDPYNGQPLKISRVATGWRVYSVGPNLKDDGGRIEKSEDVGVGADGS